MMYNCCRYTISLSLSFFSDKSHTTNQFSLFYSLLTYPSFFFTSLCIYTRQISTQTLTAPQNTHLFLFISSSFLGSLHFFAFSLVSSPLQDPFFFLRDLVLVLGFSANREKKKTPWILRVAFFFFLIIVGLFLSTYPGMGLSF